MGNELLQAEEEGTGTDRVADKALLLEPAQQVDMTAAVFRQREHDKLNMKQQVSQTILNQQRHYSRSNSLT